MAWNEVAANLFHRRYQPLDISVGVIRGADGFGVVDTRSSPHQADELRADLRELGDLPVVWVVNTHARFDHCFAAGGSRWPQSVSDLTTAVAAAYAQLGTAVDAG
jgi:glyoxylase-like metal-dependent hydrolase (beta-lactamase superfamily II)